MIVRIFRPAFTVRRSLVVLGAVVGGLVFPAISTATPYQITTSPIHKGSKGFMLSLNFREIPTGYGARYISLAGILAKTSGNASENDTYAFSATKKYPVKFTGNLSSATINATFANGRGSAKLTWHATGKLTHITVPKGCKSDIAGVHRGRRRTGTLSGSFTLHADKLGPITQKGFKKATIQTVFWTCHPHMTYQVQTAVGVPYVNAFMGPSGKVTEQIEQSTNNFSQGWAFTHTFSIRGLPSSDYSLNKAKLNSATVKGAGGIRGTAKYTSSQSSSHQTKGKMSGSLAVTLASIGPVTAFKNGRPALQKHF